jgi:hypothetical protein
MKRLIIFLLVVAAAWFGYKKYPEFVSQRPGHVAVVENGMSATLERVRVTVDGQTFAKESIPENGTAEFPFKVNNDSPFRVDWRVQGRLGEFTWSGGMVPRGPMLQRHIFRIGEDNQVDYRPENK